MSWCEWTTIFRMDSKRDNHLQTVYGMFQFIHIKYPEKNKMKCQLIHLRNRIGPTQYSLHTCTRTYAIIKTVWNSSDWGCWYLQKRQNGMEWRKWRWGRSSKLLLAVSTFNSTVIAMDESIVRLSANVWDKRQCDVLWNVRDPVFCGNLQFKSVDDANWQIFIIWEFIEKCKISVSYLHSAHTYPSASR